MTDLPPGWEWTTLEELASPEPRSITDGPFGSNLKSSHYTASGARVFRLQNIGDGVFRDEKAYISLEHFEQLRAHEAREGDLLFASLGEAPPRACLVPRLNEPAIVKADCIRIRLSPHVDPQWVLYTLLSPATKRHAGALIKGVGRPRLGLQQIRSIPIPLPPLNEQRRIVATLEDHLSRIEAGDASLARSESQLAKLKDAAIDSLLTKLSTAPRRPLGDLLRTPLRNGYSGRAAEDGTGVRTLTLSAVTKGEFSDRNTKIAVIKDRDISDLWIEPGDIFVQRSNTPELVGTCAIYKGKSDWAIFPDLLIRVRTNEEVSPEFVYLVLSSSSAHDTLKKAAKGLAGSMPKIDQGTLARLDIPVPPVEVQIDTVRQAGVLTSSLGHLKVSLATSRTRGQLLRKSLLNDAFTGQLVRQDLDDEPASTLLARINAERAAQSKPKRTRKTKPVQETLL
ncbi:restriction endonuclease subunit S [Amycolatopsis oliviviridis]|uniref:Type I restriction modification DNA specificity domain-containing protein n=1 Tax=Amycolatopsis oliviviridis TaxID=1471590 RepID=A0ABQ3LL25_9PSEU|nr:restriction endonuclease subunit S [Amycolatopsis oliviviridis]GHH18031.1 hypothetical protein GCM10017790_35700 [Amycolatopsis oliviviridis]